MPPKTQLSDEDLTTISARVNEVNALRLLSKEFKIGQGRIRRIWKAQGAEVAKYREAAYRRPLQTVEITDSIMELMLNLASKLDRVKPWPATQDKLKGLPPLSDDDQLERYLTTLSITNIGGLTANRYYNAVMLNALEQLPRDLYTRFASELQTRQIFI